jgi:hypothetical protein
MTNEFPDHLAKYLKARTVALATIESTEEGAELLKVLRQELLWAENERAWHVKTRAYMGWTWLAMSSTYAALFIARPEAPYAIFGALFLFSAYINFKGPK